MRRVGLQGPAHTKPCTPHPGPDGATVDPAREADCKIAGRPWVVMATLTQSDPLELPSSRPARGNSVSPAGPR